MPELPEVQTVVNDLNKLVVGRRIIDVWFDTPKIIKKMAPARFVGLLKASPASGRPRGAKILGLRRRAKNILIDLDGDRVLLIHQKMTGHLLVGKWKMVGKMIWPVSPPTMKEQVNDYIRLLFVLDRGQMLALSDLRKFAKVLLGSRREIESLPEIRNLGPEPLDPHFVFPDFSQRIGRGRRKIKQVLMDQSVISGIGNIYSDDILWQARVNPFKAANRISVAEKRAIWLAMKTILRKAIKRRGTSTSDFRDPAGKPGKYTDVRLVYQREGEPCPRCATPIKRAKMGGRSAHYCPQCQK